MDGRLIFYIWEIVGISFAKLKVAVMIPVIRKISTAPIDLEDSLGSPHNPWPLVQPEAICVPAPTRNPEIIKCVLAPNTPESKG